VQTLSARRAILNADDLGYDPAVSRGILTAMQKGLVSSATLMVNTPFSEAAARGARGLSVGLHLNLARWAPLASEFPAGLLRSGEFDEALAPQLTAAAAESETQAQLARLEVLLGAPATHVDVHKHLHRHPRILEGVAWAAAKRGLPVRALDEPMRRALRQAGVRVTDHFAGDAGASAYWTLERWREVLGQLSPGLTELMCHPGQAPSEVRSGYAEQREVELATFLSPEARRALTESGVTLTDFRALTPPQAGG
jgi:predicted glycoside hydrolase/deacetylase ChbG (UPF0249 family)